MLKSKDAMINDADAKELIDELSNSTSENIQRLRQHTRLSVRVKIVVEPGSLSQRQGVRLQGVTGDVSAGGSQVLLPRPLLIGDLYLVTFDREQLDLAPVYAMCVRGRLVKADAFEAGLRFLEPVTLPGSSAESEGIV